VDDWASWTSSRCCMLSMAGIATVVGGNVATGAAETDKQQVVLTTHIHTHPFNGPFSRTTQVSRDQKSKTNLDFTKARDSEWQWHQMGHMQVCTSLQTDNHASSRPLSFYRPDFLPPNQQRQGTGGK